MAESKRDRRATGALLKARRESLDKTQAEVAAEVGVTQAAVSSWESGETVPDSSRVRDVARAYDVTVDDVLPEVSA